MKRKSLLLASALTLVCVVLSVGWLASRPKLPQILKPEQPVSIPAVDQRDGDAQKGKYALLNGAYVSCGLPARIVRDTPEYKKAVRLVGRTGEGRDLPYNYNLVRTPKGTEIIASNCLTCHAAKFNGELVLGLGNEFLDFTESASRVVERAGLLVKGEDETAAWKHFADRIEAVAPYTVASTVGVNVANNLTFALISHFDPVTLKWSDDPLIDPPVKEPLPVSVPPWWRMSKKNGLFYQGQGRGDHARFMLTAALLCINGVEEVKEIDSYASDIRAYLASLQAPEYPFTIDRELAAEGRLEFERTCSRCHGTYEEQPSYPNLIVPLDIIGSDPALALQTADDNERFNRWFEMSIYGTDTDTVPAYGYMAPPLDGVWATAPYLHNGSVPDIAVLLNSSKRPDFWQYDNQRAYDQTTLGWTYAKLDSGKRDNKDRETNRRIYDTTLFGYGNSGHQFADGLSTTDRKAVIEYIKTL